MIEEPALMTIKQNLRRASREQIAAFQNVPTGFVVDALAGSVTLEGIGPVDVSGDLPGHMAGSALTADNGPADILATQCALSFITEGDILVAAHHGFQGCASIGDSLMGMMKNGGGTGFVSDAPVRDIQGIREVGLPVFATGLTPETPFSKGPGKVGFPVTLGGRTVANGDIIVADIDGVVVVPFEDIDYVIAELDKIRQLEKVRDEKVQNGLRVPAHIEEFLKSSQVTFED